MTKSAILEKVPQAINKAILNNGTLARSCPSPCQSGERVVPKAGQQSARYPFTLNPLAQQYSEYPAVQRVLADSPTEQGSTTASGQVTDRYNRQSSQKSRVMALFGKTQKALYKCGLNPIKNPEVPLTIIDGTKPISDSGLACGIPKISFGNWIQPRKGQALGFMQKVSLPTFVHTEIPIG